MTTSTPSADPESGTEPLSPRQVVWAKLRKQRLAMIGGGILVLLYCSSILAGFIAPYRYERQDRERFFHPPTLPHWKNGALVVPKFVSQPGQYKYSKDPSGAASIRWFVEGESYRLLGVFPTQTHLFGSADPDAPIFLLGTDQFGRDIFSRVVYGSQISLSIGLIGICLTYSVGILMGGVAGYFGGRVDTVLMRLCELLMSIPGLYLIMSLRATFPAGLSSTEVYLLIVVILSFVGWAPSARVIRGMALSIRERPFVLAARALGQTHWKTLWRHVLPNTWSYVVVAATLSVPYYILGEVVLSFLNVGIKEPEASWGVMLTAAQNTEALYSHPWLLAPGVAIFITVLAFNFLGDGLRDALDARLE